MSKPNVIHVGLNVLIIVLDLVVDRVRWTKAIRDMACSFSAPKSVHIGKPRLRQLPAIPRSGGQILNKLMCKDAKSQIPDSATADAFSKFFTQKVESVRSATENAVPPSFTPCPKPCCFDYFSAFDDRAGFVFD